jgi:hypothetical protein
LTTQLTAAQVELAETKKSLVGTQETLRQSEDSKRRLDATLNMRSGSLAACEAKNDSLYRTGGALLKRYEEKGCFDALLQSEPVTQIKGSDMENQVEDYRQRLELDRANQKAEDARNQRRLQVESDRRAIEKADQELDEQKRAEQEKLRRLKNKQQSDLNKITRGLSNIFKDIEW